MEIQTYLLIVTSCRTWPGFFFGFCVCVCQCIHPCKGFGNVGATPGLVCILSHRKMLLLHRENKRNVFSWFNSTTPWRRAVLTYSYRHPFHYFPSLSLPFHTTLSSVHCQSYTIVNHSIFQLDELSACVFLYVVCCVCSSSQLGTECKRATSMVTPPVLHGWLLNGVCGVLNDSPPPLCPFHSC